VSNIAELPTQAFRPASRLGAIWWEDITFAPGEERPLVKRLLSQAAMSVVYGPSGCGKSFCVIDLSLHIALGWPWRDLTVQRGGVIYVAAEGGRSVQKRVVAFRDHHGVTEKDVPFALVPTAINLLRPDDDTEALIAEIKDAAGRIGMPIRLVVIDTLSRAFAGGKENAPEDMGAFVANLDRIREETGAHTLVVHHSGKQEASGARGHSLLRAATDTEIEIRRTEGTKIATASVRKQRDGEEDQEFSFKLQRVVLGEDNDGDPITTCVVIPVESVDNPVPKTRVTGATKVALDLLKRAIADAGEAPPPSNQIPGHVRVVRSSLWKAYCEKGQIADGETPDAIRKAFKRAAERLQAAEIIGVHDEWVWLTK